MDKLTCPHCEIDFSSDFEKVMSKDLFKKYKKFKLNNEV